MAVKIYSDVTKKFYDDEETALPVDSGDISPGKGHQMVGGEQHVGLVDFLFEFLEHDSNLLCIVVMDKRKNIFRGNHVEGGGSPQAVHHSQTNPVGVQCFRIDQVHLLTVKTPQNVKKAVRGFLRMVFSAQIMGEAFGKRVFVL